MSTQRVLAACLRFAHWLSAIGNHDFCPWANRYVYWLKQPIGWFAVAALAAGLTGAFVAPQCAVVLVVMVMGTAWPWLAMRGLAAEIAFDRRRCHELDAVTVSLTVTNRWPWPVWGLLVEHGFDRGVGCHTYPLSKTFFVIATQNPVESHGAYPLPEAQLDRFAMKLRIGYPDRKSELEMLAANIGATDGVRMETEPVICPTQLCQLQQHVSKVELAEAVREYLVDLGQATRKHKAISLGLSPRGLITWQRIAQARAHLRGRDFVTPDDIQDVAGPVLEVRLAGDFDAAPRIVEEILAAVSVPVFR